MGEQVGAIAKPDDIRFTDNLPKTRSGKIMRRLLRAIARGEEITQDTSTLENEAILGSAAWYRLINGYALSTDTSVTISRVPSGAVR